MEKGLHMGQHVRYAAEKMATAVAALSKIMPNVKGPTYFTRKLYCSVAHSTALYAAPVWVLGLDIETHNKYLIREQRKILLRTASAYRTVSAAAVQVITAIPPIDLLARERSSLYRSPYRHQPGVQRQQRQRTIQRWQCSWSAHVGSAAWTQKLIPDVEKWVSCRHKTTNYWFTQFLTGHGSFETYRNKIGKTEDPNCFRCGVPDSPEHMVMDCVRWQEQRQKLTASFGCAPDCSSLMDKMIGDQRIWSEVYSYITGIMEMKEVEDRDRTG